jgi:hypothetical protein
MCAAVAMEPEERGELESSSGLLERMDQELAALIQKGKGAAERAFSQCSGSELINGAVAPVLEFFNNQEGG